jgi:TIR domain
MWESLQSMSYDWRKWLPAGLTEGSISSTQATSEGPTNLFDWTIWLPQWFKQTRRVDDRKDIALEGVRVFISYAREDLDRAKTLYDDLTRVGINVWLDKISLLPGQKWKTAIREAIEKSRYFIALLSRNSIETRGYIHKELKEALDVLDTFPPQAIYVIPARLDDCDLSYQELRKINYVDLFPDWHEGVKKIIYAISYKSK